MKRRFQGWLVRARRILFGAFVLTVVALALLATTLRPSVSEAFTDGAFRLGLGWYQQNALGEITKSADASASLTGANYYPLMIKYDYLVTTEWYVSPQLTYTPIGRDSGDAATTTTLLQFVLPVGFDLYKWTESSLDWQFGLGVNYYSVKGNGGSSALLNGSTPTTFQKPSRSVTSKTAIFVLGSAFNYGASRFGFDFVFEGLLSDKRSPSILISYTYKL